MTMGKLLERCRELRADPNIHYGCSQAVFIPVAEALGMDPDTAYKLSQHFRAGMLTGGTCGAVTGALMALGLAGASPQAAVQLQQKVKAAHQDTLDCALLLKRWHEAGNPNRKPHCDQMCYECMALVEEILEGKAE